jgi:hypothetical protein
MKKGFKDTVSYIVSLIYMEACCQLAVYIFFNYGFEEKAIDQASVNKDYHPQESGLQSLINPVNYSLTLKGLSSKNYQGSKVVSVDRYSMKDVLDLLFNYFSFPKSSKA